MDESDPPDPAAQAFRRAIRARDHAAWTRLTAECYPILLRYALRHAPTPADADDVVGETLYRAFKRARLYDAIRSPFPWLARICVNECHNRRRWLRGFRRPKDPVAIGRDARDRVHEHEAGVALRSALERLTAHERVVVHLRFGLRVSVDEIARVLGKSRDNVVRTVTRGLRKLRASPRAAELREWLVHWNGECVERRP